MAGGKQYTVQQGDTLVQIAHQNGFRAWEPIWNHAGNDELRALRKNAHVLAPGDKVFIPEPQPDEYACETKKRHTFRLKPLKQFVQQQILDDSGDPAVGKKYQLKAGASSYQGKTDGDGRVLHEIPLDVKKVELSVWLSPPPAPPLEWELELGHLDPVDLVQGVQARLNNLGYHCGEVDGSLNDATREALRWFQREHGLPPDGEINDQVKSALLTAHDQGLEGRG